MYSMRIAGSWFSVMLASLGLLSLTVRTILHSAVRRYPAEGFFQDSFPGLPAWIPGIKPSLLHAGLRSEEHTSELQSLMRISYAVFCLIKKTILQIKKKAK